MTVYRSKIGLELLIPVSIVLGIAAIVTIHEENWSGLTIILFVIALFAHAFIQTFYTVSNNTLRIQCSFLINTVVEIDSIKKITETNNLFGAPATSIDRLEILYNQHDSITISPKDKSGFIEQLTRLNQNIEVVLKK